MKICFSEGKAVLRRINALFLRSRETATDFLQIIYITRGKLVFAPGFGYNPYVFSQKEKAKMCFSKYAGALFACALLTLTAFPAAAAETRKPVEPVKLVVDSDYIDGKVNDPVSKGSRKAFIVCDNAAFHLESADGSELSADVVFYINEYVEGQDIGVRNRVMKKTLTTNETAQLLPDEVYDADLADGSAFDFADRCYSVRVYLDSEDKKYQDYYFGLVDDSMFSDMYNDTIDQ